jgi:hypothetical protein
MMPKLMNPRKMIAKPFIRTGDQMQISERWAPEQERKKLTPVPNTLVLLGARIEHRCHDEKSRRERT